MNPPLSGDQQSLARSKTYQLIRSVRLDPPAVGFDYDCGVFEEVPCLFSISYHSTDPVGRTFAQV